MVKLTRDMRGNLPRIVVEGRLESPDLAELRVQCRGRAGELALGGLVGADESGWGLLRELKRAGWRVSGASLYAARMLEEADS